MKCKECNQVITESFSSGGYEDYCYNCGYIAACKDYDNMLKEDFLYELNQEDPDFTCLYEIGETFI